MIALIRVNSKALPLINRWTSPKKGLCGCKSTIHLQRAQQRVYRVAGIANLIRVNAVGEAGAVISHSNQIKPP